MSQTTVITQTQITNELQKKFNDVKPLVKFNHELIMQAFHSRVSSVFEIQGLQICIGGYVNEKDFETNDNAKWYRFIYIPTLKTAFYF